MWITQVWHECWTLLEQSAVFILLGFVIAALLHVWMSRGRMAETIRRAEARSVFMATLVGAPLPLCSCAVVPAAMALRRQGASKGATLAFLISTPETGVTSILLTYGLLGPVMAIVRPIAACCTAIVAGIMANLLDRGEPANGSYSATPTGASPLDHGAAPPPADQGALDVSHAHPHRPPRTHPQPASFADGFRHAFIDIFDDVVGWMLISFAVAAVINVNFPDILVSKYLSESWIAMLVMLAIGVPLYVCAEASTPIAAAMIAKGISPGAALVFLLCGPATNLGSLAVVNRQLGRRTTLVYLASICCVALVCGASLDLLMKRASLPVVDAAPGAGSIPPVVAMVAAVLFLMLSVWSLLRQQFPRRLLDLVNSVLPFNLSPRTAQAVLVAAALVVYAGSGIVFVQPNEVGIVKRWGRVVEQAAQPGLHFVWPWPIGAIDRVRPDAVRRTLLGVATPGADGKVDADDKTGWMWLGDENVASLKYAVHWSVAPGRHLEFAYGLADADGLVRAAAQAACRQVVATYTIDMIYTTHRTRAERAILEQLQQFCDRTAGGLRIDSFEFLDVHAPAEVHEAFRDVASALEDKAKFIDLAWTDWAGKIPRAGGEALARIADARAEATHKLAQARGEGAAFLALLDAARVHPQVTQVRMYYDMLRTVLPTVRKYLRTGSTPGRPLELWLKADRPAPAEAM